MLFGFSLRVIFQKLNQISEIESKNSVEHCRFISIHQKHIQT